MPHLLEAFVGFAMKQSGLDSRGGGEVRCAFTFSHKRSIGMMSLKEKRMSIVEEAYRRSVDAMTPAEKIARMVALNEWGRWNVARCITEEYGPLPAEELKWRVALSLYGRNPDCRKLIEEQLARVCDR